MNPSTKSCLPSTCKNSINFVFKLELDSSKICIINSCVVFALLRKRVEEISCEDDEGIQLVEDEGVEHVVGVEGWLPGG